MKVTMKSDMGNCVSGAVYLEREFSTAEIVRKSFHLTLSFPKGTLLDVPYAFIQHSISEKGIGGIEIVNTNLNFYPIFDFLVSE